MQELSSLEKLNNAIEDFYRSRLILADRVIADFLKTVAADDALISVVSEAAGAAGYAAEYKKAITKDGISSFFLLPTGAKQIITLVTGLLYEFDNNTLSIIDFVTKFFPSDTANEAYTSFCNRIIKPYAEAFKARLVGEPDAVYQAMADATPKLQALPDKAKEDCNYWLGALLDSVTGDNGTPEDKRREFVIMIKGMMYVLDSHNPILIKLLWIGLKNTLGAYKPGKRELQELKSLLHTYGVLD